MFRASLNEQFDVIISNPPFSIREDARTLAQYQTRFAYAEWKNSENLFVERWYQFLKEGGRLGVVLPDSVFDTNENLYIRMFLYRFFHIRAVVSLPVVTFQPYTPTKTSLLFAQKKTKKHVDLWDTAWRKAANEYGQIRRSNAIQYVLKTDRLRSSLIDLSGRADVEWYPSTSLLSSDSLPADTRAQITLGLKESPSQLKRLEAVLMELDYFVDGKELDSLEKDKDLKSTLRRLLRDRFPDDAAKLSAAALIEMTYDEIVEAAELNYTEDPKGQNYCNAWWCFAEVAGQEKIQNDIFFAEADRVGYKRTTRHPDGIPQPNDLFTVDEAGYIVIDVNNPKTILDALRKANVFSS